MDKYDLVITGAGLAGLSLARELKGSGLRIIIIEKRCPEKMIAYHSSGTFMDPGQFSLPEGLFHRLDYIRFSSRNNHVVKPVKSAYVIERKELYEHLRKEISEDPCIEFLYSNELTGVELREDRGISRIECTCGNHKKYFSASFFADCTGVAAKLAGICGLNKQFPVMAAGLECIHKNVNDGRTAVFFIGSEISGCYGWLFPKSGNKIITGIGTIVKSQYPKLRKLFEQVIISRIEKLGYDTDVVDMNFAALRTGKPLKRFSYKNVIILGDSASQANPLIGEGIRFVMFASKCAAEAIKNAVSACDEGKLKIYDKLWLKKYYQQYNFSYFMQKILRFITKYDWIMDKGVEVMKTSSSHDFRRILSADISPWLFIRLFLEAFWKIKILGKKI